MKQKIYLFAALALLAVHFFAGLDTIRRLSPTYDEPLHLAAGYSYWKTDKFYLNIYDHPPLAEMTGAIPLLSMNPALPTSHPAWQNYEQYSFADLFLYKNSIDAEKMLNSGRVAILIVSCLLGFLIFRWASELYGGTAALLVLSLYVFSSNFLAHATLVTTDLVFVFFFTLGTYFLWKWFNTQLIKYSILCGVFTGLAFCSKYSAGILLLAYLLVFFFGYRKNKKVTTKLISHGLIFLGALAITILFVYRFSQAGLYFEGLRYLTKQMGRGRSSFLFGQYSTTGWSYYFVLLALIKTPVAFIALFAGSFFFLKKYNKEHFAILLVPPLLYFTVSSFSKVQIGMRHILPIYPFLFLWAGNLFKYLGSRFKQAGWAVSFVLILLYAAEFAVVHPWHLSYFNKAAGGPENGSKYLTDSNIDWGQGLKELRRWVIQQNKAPVIYMCYFGVGDPHYYGIQYIPIGFINNMKPQERPGDAVFPGKNEPIIFAISVTNLKATYYADKKTFSWLEEFCKPVAVAAQSIFIYDLTDKPDCLRKLGDLYGQIGNAGQKSFLYSRAAFVVAERSSADLR